MRHGARMDAATRPPRLLAALRARIRARHYSARTEEAYVRWVRRFVRFHGGRHPRELGDREIVAFLTHLATARRVSASTQNQALSALLFLYAEVLGLPMGRVEGIVRAKRPHRLPVVLTRREVTDVLGAMRGVHRLVGGLLYGGGLRLLECCRLRVKDVDLERRELTIRGGKGDRDRRTMLPGSLAGAVERQLERVRALHARGRGAGRRLSRAPWRDGPEDAGRGARLALAVALPRRPAVPRRRKRRVAPAPRASDRRAAGGGRGGAAKRDRQAGELSHLPALVRDPPAGVGLRHQDRAGAAGPSGCADDDDLHARVEPGRAGCAESGGQSGAGGRGGRGGRRAS
jgi:integrase